MTGSVIGGIIALCILKKYQKQQLSWLHFAWPTVAQIKELFRTERYLLSRLLIEGGLLTLYTGLLIVFQLVDSFTVANGLHQAGLSMFEKAKFKRHLRPWSTFCTIRLSRFNRFVYEVFCLI